MQKPLYLAVAVCAASLLLFVTPAPTRADSIGGDTSVALNSTTVTAWGNLGITLSPLGSATFNATTMTLTFPITHGTISSSGDVLFHDGSGFSLTENSATVTFRNLVIDTAAGTLSGNVHFGNTQLNGVTLFNIGTDGVLTLNAQAATQLGTAFGLSNLAGTNIGNAAISLPLDSPGGSVGSNGGATSTPEPSTFALLIGVVLAAGALATFRSFSRRQFAQA